MSMHPTLQRAKAKLGQRRAERGPLMQRTIQERQHEPLQLAYKTAGSGSTLDGEYVGMLYLTIRYCPACLRGTVVDLARSVPQGTPDARKLELLEARPWRLDCPAKY